VPNDVRLRRIFFFPQGAPEGAYSRYVTEGVTAAEREKGKQNTSVDA